MVKTKMDSILIMAVKKQGMFIDKKQWKKIPKKSIYKKDYSRKVEFIQHREKISFLGKILDENYTDKTLVLEIGDGSEKYNPCIAVISLEDKYIYIDAFAEERLFHKNLSENTVKNC